LRPHAVGGLPDFGCLDAVAPHFGATDDRQIGLGFRVDKRQPDIVLGLDLVLLAAAQIGHEPDEARGAAGPRFQWPRPEASGEARVSMHTPTYSTMSQTRSRCCCSAMPD
jgi:hypothetical protein